MPTGGGVRRKSWLLSRGESAFFDGTTESLFLVCLGPLYLHHLCATNFLGIAVYFFENQPKIRIYHVVSVNFYQIDGGGRQFCIGDETRGQ